MVAEEDITYCSNVHPGETATDVLDNLEYTNRVRQQRNLEEMACGLWFSNQALSEFRQPGLRQKLKRKLQEYRLFPTSINGFPYGGFHAESVKEKVYLPDWSQKERFIYTTGLAELAKDLLTDAPSHLRHCAISTVPLGFKESFDEAMSAAAREQILEAAHSFYELENRSRIRLTLCLEMEPACMLEKTSDVLAFWQTLRSKAVTKGESYQKSLNNNLGLCYDICHQAVMFENIYESLASLIRAGISIYKFQVSSAIEARFSHDRSSIISRLRDFNEPRYLHQTTVKNQNGLQYFTDLPRAFDSVDGEIWRIHYHVPIHIEAIAEDAGLYTTRGAITEVLDFLQSQNSPGNRTLPVFEVETYTWTVLPVNVRKNYNDIVHAIGLEIDYLVSEMKTRNLIS